MYAEGLSNSVGAKRAIFERCEDVKLHTGQQSAIQESGLKKALDGLGEHRPRRGHRCSPSRSSICEPVTSSPQCARRIQVASSPPPNVMGHFNLWSHGANTAKKDVTCAPRL